MPEITHIEALKAEARVVAQLLRQHWQPDEWRQMILMVEMDITTELCRHLLAQKNPDA